MLNNFANLSELKDEVNDLMTPSVPDEFPVVNGYTYPIQSLNEVSGVFMRDFGKGKKDYVVYADIEGRGSVEAFVSKTRIPADNFSREWQKHLATYLNGALEKDNSDAVQIASQMVADVEKDVEEKVVTADLNSRTGDELSEDVGLGDPAKTRLFKIEYTGSTGYKFRDGVITLLNQVETPSPTFMEKCEDYADKHECDLLIVFSEVAESGNHIHQYVNHKKPEQRAYTRERIAEGKKMDREMSKCFRCGSVTCNSHNSPRNSFLCKQKVVGAYLVKDEGRVNMPIPKENVEVWAQKIVDRYHMPVVLVDGAGDLVKRFE